MSLVVSLPSHTFRCSKGGVICALVHPTSLNNRKGSPYPSLPLLCLPLQTKGRWHVVNKADSRLQRVLHASHSYNNNINITTSLNHTSRYNHVSIHVAYVKTQIPLITEPCPTTKTLQGPHCWRHFCVLLRLQPSIELPRSHQALGGWKGG